jgi:hypothetical protein
MQGAVDLPARPRHGYRDLMHPITARLLEIAGELVASASTAFGSDSSAAVCS